MTTREYVSVTETAKLLRQALKAAHPGVRFSVRSSSYSGGASIRVRWTDGPTEEQVKRTAKLYQGASFDGMTDSTDYHDTVLVGADGSMRHVHFGADHVFVERDLSPEFIAAAAAFIAAQDHRGTDRQAAQCRHCGNWKPAGYDGWYVARGARGYREFVCSPECGARVEIRYGHIRPSSRR